MSFFGAAFKESDHVNKMDGAAEVASGGNIPTAEALVGATEGIKKRGRGRPKGSGGKTGASTPDGANDARVMLDKLFDPKLWGPLISMPADSMLALTGHEHWNLSGIERETLGATASTAAQYMGIENPKTLAVSLLLINIAMVYAPRALKEFSMMREKREKSTEKNPHGS